MIEYSKYTWKKDKCYLGTEYIGEVKKDHHTPTMFRFIWPDGHESEDYFNKDRAKDNLILLDLRRRNTRPPSQIE